MNKQYMKISTESKQRSVNFKENIL